MSLMWLKNKTVSFPLVRVSTLSDSIFLANISRIMKRVVPVEGKLSKEARECVQECVTEFIQFIVSEASDMCIQEKRKTINSEDLLKALGKLSFDPYLDALKTYIEGYRAAQKNGNSVSITTYYNVLNIVNYCLYL